MWLLFGLQAFHVLFLLLHDWAPLGRLSDVAALKRLVPKGKLVLASLLSTLPFAWLLWATSRQMDRPRLGTGLLVWLWVGYIFLFAGELRAWWVPYLRGAKPELVERYRELFGRTLAFLPERNGIRVNTLHVLLHSLTVLTLLTLAVLTVGR